MIVIEFPSVDVLLDAYSPPGNFHNPVYVWRTALPEEQNWNPMVSEQSALGERYMVSFRILRLLGVNEGIVYCLNFLARTAEEALRIEENVRSYLNDKAGQYYLGREAGAQTVDGLPARPPVFEYIDAQLHIPPDRDGLTLLAALPPTKEDDNENITQ